MLNSQVLEIAGALVFVYLLASLLATAIREMVEGLLKTRAVQLERGLRLLLDDPTGKETTAALFAHPQIFSLFDGVYDPAQLTRHIRFWKRSSTLREGVAITTRALRLPLFSKFPSYIPSRNFALALLDMVGHHGTQTSTASAFGASVSMETLLAHASALAPGRLRDALLVALTEAQGDFDRARTSLEAWFDSNMDRVSGWYKRETQVILLAIGLASAVLFNIDTISIVRELADNNTVRAQVVLQAEVTRQAMLARGDALPKDASILDANALNNARKGLGDLVGWSGRSWRWGTGTSWGDWQALVGWTLTAIAISLGAPFWFDLLNKIMVVRATVKPFEKSPAEGSQDRAGSTPSADRLEPQRPAPAAPADGGGGLAALTGKTLTGSVRLATHVAGLSNLALTVDGKPTPVSASGLLDLPLTMGDDHELKMTASDAAGTEVAWLQTVRVTLDDDAQAIDAALVPLQRAEAG